MRAAVDHDHASILHELDMAAYFEGEAMKVMTTHRQHALALGLLHTVDMMRAIIGAQRSESVQPPAAG